MQRWALISSGVVVNSVVADADFIENIRSDYDAVINTTEMVPWPSVDWTWDGETFAPAPEPEPQA